MVILIPKRTLVHSRQTAILEYEWTSLSHSRSNLRDSMWVSFAIRVWVGDMVLPTLYTPYSQKRTECSWVAVTWATVGEVVCVWNEQCKAGRQLSPLGGIWTPGRIHCILSNVSCNYFRAWNWLALVFFLWERKMKPNQRHNNFSIFNCITTDMVKDKNIVFPPQFVLITLKNVKWLFSWCLSSCHLHSAMRIELWLAIEMFWRREILVIW